MPDAIAAFVVGFSAVVMVAIIAAAIEQYLRHKQIQAELDEVESKSVDREFNRVANEVAPGIKVEELK